jgi:hypothetical protein
MKMYRLVRNLLERTPKTRILELITGGFKIGEVTMTRKGKDLVVVSGGVMDGEYPHGFQEIERIIKESYEKYYRNLVIRDKRH